MQMKTVRSGEDFEEPPESDVTDVLLIAGASVRDLAVCKHRSQHARFSHFIMITAVAKLFSKAYLSVSTPLQHNFLETQNKLRFFSKSSREGKV